MSHQPDDWNRDRASQAAEVLIEAVRRLAVVNSIEEVTSVVKTAARRMVQADGATFVLRDNGQCHYVDEDAIGPLWKGKRFPMESCISGWTMMHRQPAFVPDVTCDDRIPLDAYLPTFVRSLAMVPIRSLSPIGAIGIYWAAECKPTTEAVRWLQSLADSTALAIEHLEARLNLLEARHRVELLTNSTRVMEKDLKRLEPAATVRMCFLTQRFDVDGEWLSIEAFLQKRFGLSVSHGLCPEGFARLEANLAARTNDRPAEAMWETKRVDPAAIVRARKV